MLFGRLALSFGGFIRSFPGAIRAFGCAIASFPGVVWTIGAGILPFARAKEQNGRANGSFLRAICLSERVFFRLRRSILQSQRPEEGLERAGGHPVTRTEARYPAAAPFYMQC